LSNTIVTLMPFLGIRALMPNIKKTIRGLQFVLNEHAINITPDKLSFIQKSLDMGEYDVVIKECSTLFEVSLKKIFKEAIISLPFNERTELQDCEKKIGKNTKGVQDFSFGEVVGLFRESKLMSKWAKHSSRDLGLLNTLDFAPIVKLRNELIHEGLKCSRFEAELVYNFLRNLLATIGYADLNSPIGSSMPKNNIEGLKVNKNENVKIFNCLSDRGLIVNPSDGSRNISLKVDTLNKIFDIIYNEITQISSNQVAQNILWKAGCESGKSFGTVMNKKWEVECEIHTINEKIDKWCEFDSDVGWGKFINDIKIDHDLGEVSGSLVISENFQNNNRGKKDPLICFFIKGYCEGVIEELLGGLKVETNCDMEVCPQNNVFKKKCILSIGIKED